MIEEDRRFSKRTTRRNFVGLVVTLGVGVVGGALGIGIDQVAANGTLRGQGEPNKTVTVVDGDIVIPPTVELYRPILARWVGGKMNPPIEDMVVRRPILYTAGLMAPGTPRLLFQSPDGMVSVDLNDHNLSKIAARPINEGGDSASPSNEEEFSPNPLYHLRQVVIESNTHNAIKPRPDQYPGIHSTDQDGNQIPVAFVRDSSRGL